MCFRTNFTGPLVFGECALGGSPPDRTDIVRKETQFKVSALCISYFRTVQTFLEAEVATSHPKCNTSLESPC